jgi:hypothetical protein
MPARRAPAALVLAALAAAFAPPGATRGATPSPPPPSPPSPSPRPALPLPVPPGVRAKALAVRLDPWRFHAGPPPAGWADPAFDDRAWAGPAPGPFAPRTPPLPTPPPPATLYDLVPGAPLLLRARFAVADAARARVLELRVAYADGFVAYVNGREVARQGVAAARPPAPPGALVAVVPHGPEVERVPIAVPSPALPSLRPDGNLLAIALYATAGRSTIVPSAPAAAIDVGAASGVRIIRGPYLAAPVDGRQGAGVEVLWETDLPAAGAVTVEAVVARPGEAPRRLAVGAATRHAVAVGGLAAGAAYRYRVDVDAGAGDVAAAGPSRFETLAAPPAPLRFAVYGDMRYPGHEAHRAIVDALVREAPAVVFNTGDLTDVGSEESNWQRYFDITAPLGAIAPVVPALGNHDAARAGTGSARAWELFRVPASPPPGWTSLDLGGAHFVILDTNEMRNPDQRAWLADDLARARRHHPRAIFAFCHEGPWSHALHAGESRMVHDYAPLLARAHVDVLFSGHDHVYERGEGVTPAGKLPYVVTGGGGAPLYNPTCAAASGPPPGDVPGPLRLCPPTVAVLTKAYHYVMVEVRDDGILVCPRRPDGSPVEPCVHLPPRRHL